MDVFFVGQVLYVNTAVTDVAQMRQQVAMFSGSQWEARNGNTSYAYTTFPVSTGVGI
ncbi:hypothetical protein [Sphingobacterium olei]|uniref:hypothetical protein n=1 Tax=Sphingobacterium olei TaxID=2571155 RepID=UPI00138FB69C|nr:hypothetical protein [Sphingobacterium olei]